MSAPLRLHSESDRALNSLFFRRGGCVKSVIDLLALRVITYRRVRLYAQRKIAKSPRFRLGKRTAADIIFGRGHPHVVLSRPPKRAKVDVEIDRVRVRFPRLADGTLAGSVLKMNVAVKNMVEKVGAPIEKALDFASFNPAKNLHMEKEIGSVAVGKRADYAVLNENFDVLCTVRNGKIIYKRR